MFGSRGQEVKVGIFVTAGICIFALFVFGLTWVGLSGDGDTYRILFKNVAGLENGSLVRLGGLKVGRVERVGISKENQMMAEAVILVERGTPISKSSKIQVTSVGVTGSMYLSISLGLQGSALFKPGSVIQGQEAASFQGAINEARETASRVNKMLEGLDETTRMVFNDVQRLVRSIRGKVSSILGTADRAMARFENILSKKNEIIVTGFLVSLGRAADRLEKNIGPAISGLQLTLGRVRQSIGRVDQTAQAFKKLAGDSSALIAQINARLAVADRLLSRFERVSEGLEKVFATSEKAVADLTLALKAELQLIRGELQKEIAGAGSSVRHEIGSVASQAKAQLRKGSAEMEGALRSAKKEIEGVGTSLRRELGNVAIQAKAQLQKGSAEMGGAFRSAKKEIEGVGTSLRHEIGSVASQAKVQLQKGSAGMEGALRSAKKEIEGVGTSLRRELGSVATQAKAQLRKGSAEMEGALRSATKEIEGVGTSLRRELGSVATQAKAQLRKGSAEMEGALRTAKKEVEGVGTSLRREIGGVATQARATLRKSGASLEKALLSVEKVAGRVDGFLVANQAELKNIFEGFGSLSKRLNTILLQISGGEGGDRLKGAAEELRLALRRANSLMGQLDDTVSSHREDIQILITDLRETARNMSDFTDTIKERPSSIILSAPAAPRTFGKR